MKPDEQFRCPKCGGPHFGAILDENYEITGYRCHNRADGSPSSDWERDEKGELQWRKRPPVPLCGWSGVLEEMKDDTD